MDGVGDLDRDRSCGLGAMAIAQESDGGKSASIPVLATLAELRVLRGPQRPIKNHEGHEGSRGKTPLSNQYLLVKFVRI